MPVSFSSSYCIRQIRGHFDIFHPISGILSVSVENSSFLCSPQGMVWRILLRSLLLFIPGLFSFAEPVLPSVVTANGSLAIVFNNSSLGIHSGWSPALLSLRAAVTSAYLPEFDLLIPFRSSRKTRCAYSSGKYSPHILITQHRASLVWN